MIRISENLAVFPGRHFVFVDEMRTLATLAEISAVNGHVAFVVGSYTRMLTRLL
jgi:hypothetical protein